MKYSSTAIIATVNEACTSDSAASAQVQTVLLLLDCCNLLLQVGASAEILECFCERAMPSVMLLMLCCQALQGCIQIPCISAFRTSRALWSCEIWSSFSAS